MSDWICANCESAVPSETASCRGCGSSGPHAPRKVIERLRELEDHVHDAGTKFVHGIPEQFAGAFFTPHYIGVFAAHLLARGFWATANRDGAEAARDWLTRHLATVCDDVERRSGIRARIQVMLIDEDASNSGAE